MLALVGRNLPAMHAADWAWLFTLGLIWGSSFLFVKIAVAEIAPLTMVLTRTAIAALLLYTLLRLRGLSLALPPALWRDLAVMGLLNNILPFSMFFWGQQYITAGLGSILGVFYTGPGLGGLIGPPTAGWLIDRADAYAPAILGAFACGVVAFSLLRTMPIGADGSLARSSHTID